MSPNVGGAATVVCTLRYVLASRWSVQTRDCKSFRWSSRERTEKKGRRTMLHTTVMSLCHMHAELQLSNCPAQGPQELGESKQAHCVQGQVGQLAKCMI